MTVTKTTSVSTPSAGCSRIAGHPFVLCLLLAAATLAVYWPVIGYQYINLDDPGYISENPHILAGLTWKGLLWAFTNGEVGFWIPLTWLSFMLDVTLFGKGPAGPHATNVLLHTLNTLLVFGVLRLLTGSTWRSAWVAAVFALHPLHVESVAWITERKDVLSTFFGLLAIGCYARYVRGPDSGRFLRSGFYRLSLLFFALGLMSKPMLVTLPFLLLLLDWWPLQRQAFARRPLQLSPALHLVWEKWPFFGLAALSSVLTFMAHRGVGGLMPVASLSLIARIGNAVMSYAWYVGSTFWPARLAVFYPYPGVRPLSLLLPLTLAGLVLTAAAFWARRKRRYVLTGWLWFLGALAPVIGVVQAGSQARADRFMYVPMIGLLILAAWGMADLGKRWRWPVRWIGLAGIVLLLLCGARAAVQVRFWRNSETLFRHALSVTGKNYLAHTCLGSVLSASGQTGEAIRHFGHALSIAPNYAWAHSNLGHALAKQGRIDEAVVHGRKAISLEPDSAEAHANLGYALAAQGRMEEAIAHCRKAISLKTDLAKAHSNLGYALAAQGRMEEAIVHCRKALSLKPDFVDAHVNLGRALAAQGHLEEAISHYNEALSLKPDLAEGHSNLGAALAAQGRVEQAITHYRKAVSLRPGLAEAHSNLGAALAAKGRVEEAIAHYLEALSLRPDLAEEHHALGGLLAAQGREDEAIGHYRKALAIKPDFAEAYFNLGALHAGRGEPGEAVTLYRQALKISPDQAAVRNNLAWLLATASEPGVRNAAESLRLAERANELTQGKIPIVLDTLAAAYAEASRFPEAVLTAQKALERAKATGQTNLIGQIQARLELYRKNEPFREKPAASGGHDTACRIE